MIYIFTGNGKGKTTAAIGTGVRMAGTGKKVLMVRFMKRNGVSSEEKVIQEIKNFEIRSFGREGFFVPESELEKNPELKEKGVRPLSKEDRKLFERGMDFAREAAEENKYGLLILDEVFLGIKFGMIDEGELANFIESRSDMDIVLTGRYCPSDFYEYADLVTEMKEIKHPYQKGEKARRGIEY